MMGLAVIAGPFSLPAHASGVEGWHADTANDRCALQFFRPAGEVLIELALDVEDGSYAVNGMVLSGYSQSDLRDLRITVQVDAETVVLSDNWDALGEFLSDKQSGTPVPILFAALDKQKATSVTLNTDDRARMLPMAGYIAARDALDSCLNAFIYRTEARSQPRLIAFTGLQALGAEAARQRVISQKLAYTLTIDELGKPIKCELARKFRRKATRIALCRPLLKTMTFAPATDPSGRPIQGTYSGVIDFEMWMRSDGYLRDH